MKTVLIAFAGLEALLVATFVLFFVSEKNTWAFPLLLVLMGISFAVGITLLLLKRKRS